MPISLADHRSAQPVRIAAGEAFYCVPCHVSGWDEDAELIVFSRLA
jgi:hypothetical protein